ncbi:uncharacterized protein LOC116620873 [Nematostella vectensis]|uniref:uncharacterized protein LOC116620873 n=1 Tax=Nematostella vectensis TaxID=45351 RepID=UPI0020774644|nr:uncharacterized protein LOC116620873 [Nematostella vectensis]
MDPMNTCFVLILPDELWVKIFQCFHPVYEDLFAIACVCKKWRNLIITNPDPQLWDRVEIRNITRCYLDSAFLRRFNCVLRSMGKHIRVLKMHHCNYYFMDVLLRNCRNLDSLQEIEVTGMAWNGNLIEELRFCSKTLSSINLEACKFKGDALGTFTKTHLDTLVDNFKELKKLGLRYTRFDNQTLTFLQDLLQSPHNVRITHLSVERSQVGPFELNEIVSGFLCLEEFSYGNDQIYGIPSTQLLTLSSTSLREVKLYQVGDFKHLALNLPGLYKVTIDASTSFQSIEINSPSLRILDITRCFELRKFKGILPSCLRKLRILDCPAFPFNKILCLLTQNPDIKILDIQPKTPSFRLDQFSCPSVECLTLLDNGEGLLTMDVSCPKLSSFTLKSIRRTSQAKSITLTTGFLEKFVLQEVVALRNVILNVNSVKYFEIDFARRIDQMKPKCYTQIFNRNLTIHRLCVKRCNLESVNLKDCKVKQVFLKNCNLGISMSQFLGSCSGLESLSLYNCYGPCRLSLANDSLKSLNLSSSHTIMETLHKMPKPERADSQWHDFTSQSKRD